MCDNINILRLISFFKNILDLITLFIPMLLILITSIDLAKMVLSNEDISKQSVSMLTKRIIAAVVVFFIPTLVFMLIGMVESDKGFLTCWTNANPEYLSKLELAQRIEEEIKKKKENSSGSTNNAVENENVNKPDTNVLDIVSTTYQPFVNGVQRPLQKGDCMKKEDNCFCPSIDGFRGFQFTVGDETTRYFNWYSLNEKMTTVTVKCSDGSKISQYVNERVKDKFELALTNICKLQTTGISGIKLSSNNIKYGGTFVARTNSSRWVCSNHSYGNAIDINYSFSTTINGKNYTPFAGQGVDTRKEYNAFINALGNELDARNVNYILWKYAFEPAGFIWGGNWEDDFFDPMHFEVK